MEGRLKSYVLIILLALVIALFLGPPLTFASKLPKACNIFQEKKVTKSGPCMQSALISKEKPTDHKTTVSSLFEVEDQWPSIIENAPPFLGTLTEIALPAEILRC